MKTIVITGAGAGLGRALARKLAAEGFAVILLGRSLAKLRDLEAELGDKAWAVECDVGSPDAVRSAFATIAERHSGIDVLINNAATYEPFMVEEASDEQILAPVLTNFLGPVYTARAASSMLPRGSHIINISSESVAMDYPMLSLYQSSKAGLERFTEALRKELEPRAVRVTLVRAGTMYDEDSRSSWAPDIHRRFAEACLRAAIDLRAKPKSHFRSIAEIVHGIIQSPPDVNMPHVSLEGFGA